MFVWAAERDPEVKDKSMTGPKSASLPSHCQLRGEQSIVTLTRIVPHKHGYGEECRTEKAVPLVSATREHGAKHRGYIGDAARRKLAVVGQCPDSGPRVHQVVAVARVRRTEGAGIVLAQEDKRHKNRNT